MKRILALLLTVVMALSAFSIGSMAATVEDYELPFTDLKDDAWYLEGISYCYNMGYVKGMTETTFAPNGTLTRAQFVQMLAGFAGEDLSAYNGLSCGFEDVKPGHWYNNAVCWAYSHGIVAGVSKTKFGPNQPITREQLARLLYVFAEKSSELNEYYLDLTPRADISGYEDAAKVSSWAREQVEWAVAAGIISGMSETTLAPRATATRAQSCRMLMVFDQYLMNGGIKDTGGAFAALVDYVVTNGESYEDEYGDTIYDLTVYEDEYAYILQYDAGVESLAIVYSCDVKEVIYDDGIYEEYVTQAYFYTDQLNSVYYFTVNHIPTSDGTVYYTVNGGITADGYSFYSGYGEGLEAITAKASADAVMEKFSSFIDWLLSEVGYTRADFFKGETVAKVERTGIFKDLPEYILANGTQDTDFFGEYELSKTDGDTMCCVEYDIFTGTVYLAYYSSPYVQDIEGEMFTVYAEEAYVYLWDAQPTYEYSYFGNPADGSYSTTVNGTSTSDGCNVDEIIADGITEDEASVKAMTAYEKLLAAAEELIAPTGYSVSDFFVTE